MKEPPLPKLSQATPAILKLVQNFAEPPRKQKTANQLHPILLGHINSNFPQGPTLTNFGLQERTRDFGQQQPQQLQQLPLNSHPMDLRMMP
jgi:hypothetical protein